MTNYTKIIFNGTARSSERGRMEQWKPSHKTVYVEGKITGEGLQNFLKANGYTTYKMGNHESKGIGIQYGKNTTKKLLSKTEFFEMIIEDLNDDDNWDEY